MNAWWGFALSFVFLSSCATSGLDAQENPAISFGFEWDESVFVMPTQVVLFAKQGVQEGLATPRELLKFQDRSQVLSPFENYEFIIERGSLRNFTDSPGENKFAQDIERALRDPQWAWRGSAWEVFARAMSVERTAKSTLVLSLRAQSPENIAAGIERLKDWGKISHAPDASHIFTLGKDPAKAFRSFGPSGPLAALNEARAKAIVRWVAEFDARPRSGSETTVHVTDHLGIAKEDLRVFAYFERDLASLETITGRLSEKLRAGAWVGTKIILFYTGESRLPAGDSPMLQALRRSEWVESTLRHALVLKRDGVPRPLHPKELREVYVAAHWE